MEYGSVLLIIDGDFNLLWSLANKNNDNFDWQRAISFNDFISSFALREIHSSGARFTWNNKQTSAVGSVLDRVLTCTAWDALFPRASLIALAHIGFDNTPLVLDSGERVVSISKRFQFESSWLLVDGFTTMFSAKISNLLASISRSFGPIDDWSYCPKLLIQFLWGWGRNRAADTHR